jgi:hypothetical protein
MGFGVARRGGLGASVYRMRRSAKRRGAVRRCSGTAKTSVHDGMATHREGPRVCSASLRAALRLGHEEQDPGRCHPRASGDPYSRGRSLGHHGSPLSRGRQHGEEARPRAGGGGDPYSRGQSLRHHGSPSHVGYSGHAHSKCPISVKPEIDARGRQHGEEARPRAGGGGDPYSRDRRLAHHGSPSHVGYSRHAPSKCPISGKPEIGCAGTTAW